MAASSKTANISPYQSKIAFKVTSEKFFGAQYHLSADHTSLEPKRQTPSTTEQFEVYKDVLLYAKTITRTKHLMTIQNKRNTALAILDTIPSDIVTVHYHTTSRNRLNGGWSSLIIKMSNWKSLNFAP